MQGAKKQIKEKKSKKRAKKERPEVTLYKSGVDKLFLIFVLIMVFAGTAMIFSASYVNALARYGDSFFFVKRQALMAAIGIGLIILMLVVTRYLEFDYLWIRVMKKSSVPFFFAVLLLNYLTPVFGRTIHGGHRWIVIGPVQFQPSELLKLAVVLLFSWYIDRMGERMHKFKWGIFIPCGVIGVIAYAMYLQQHFSGLIIIALICIAIIFIGEAPWQWLAGFAAVGFSGVAAILNEARRFVFDRETAGAYIGKQRGGKTGREDSPFFAGGAFICVFAFAGGLGTSCAAVGIGRELARYRGEQVLYLSLEDAEDTGLFPAGLHAMRAEETLYRYLRLSNTGGGQEGFAKLFRAAAARDEYGLYRLAPDEGAGSLAGLTPGELYSFLSQAFISLGLTRIVLDLGTRLNFIKTFTRVLAAKEALFIEVRPDGENQGRNSRSLFTDDQPLNAAFPVCDEDIRRKGDHTDVGLANAFGLAVKEICDRITEDAT